MLSINEYLDLQTGQTGPNLARAKPKKGNHYPNLPQTQNSIPPQYFSNANGQTCKIGQKQK